MKRLKVFIVFAFFIWGASGLAQLPTQKTPEQNIALALNQLKVATTDSARLQNLKLLTWFYRIVGKMDSALKYGNQGIELATRIGNQKFLSSMYTATGLVYWNQGSLPLALDYFFKSLKIAEQIKFLRGVGVNSVNIGNIYADENEYPKALEYYLKGMQIDSISKDTIGLILLDNNIGDIYLHLKDTNRGLRYLKHGLLESRMINYSPGLARSLNSIGDVYFGRKDYGNALNNYIAAIEPSQAAQDKTIIAQNRFGMGSVYFVQKKYTLAEMNIKECMAISDSMHYLDGIRDANKLLSDLYRETGRWQDAYQAYTKYSTAKDSLVSIERDKQIANKQFSYELEKKEVQLKAEQDIANEQKNKEEIVIYAVTAVLLLVLLLAAFVLRGYRQKQKANLQLEAQKQKVDLAFKQLNIKHTEITDSINYAKRLQQALLKTEEEITPLFTEAFIFFKPKDVVSGDFYWVTQKNGKSIIASVDCTGHGVPGALMSMMGNAFLDGIINANGITEPARILSEMRTMVIKSLKQTGAVGETRDGMDMALITFDNSSMELAYSGANNPLWRITKQAGELTFEEYKPDKRPIGYFMGKGLPFNQQKIKATKGDAFYIFTDGYADQFGGPKGKKFKYKQLKELIMANTQLSMAEQKKKLEKNLAEWKGNLEQVDDILVIGIRV